MGVSILQIGRYTADNGRMLHQGLLMVKLNLRSVAMLLLLMVYTLDVLVLPAQEIMPGIPTILALATVYSWQ